MTKPKGKTPLNNETRLLILNALMKHRFEAQDKEIKERPKQLAKDLYDSMLSPDEQAQMEACPRHWFGSVNEMYFYVDGKSFHLRMGHYNSSKPYSWRKDGSDSPHFASNSAFGKKYLKYEADKEKLTNDKFKAESATMATLKSFRYLEDLVETWPEVKKFVPTEVTKKQQMTAALAIAPKDLNAMLRLP